MNTWLPVLTAPLTGLIAVFSVWLGSRLTRAKDEQQWRRDRCLEAYADVLKGCQVVIDEAGRLFVGVSDDPNAQLVLLHQKLLELYHALNRTRLLASPEMRDICKELNKLFGEIAVSAGASPGLSIDGWRTLTGGKAGALVDRFAEQAQSDLQGSRMRRKTLRLRLNQCRHLREPSSAPRNGG
jgi:hypothetical protein